MGGCSSQEGGEKSTARGGQDNGLDRRSSSYLRAHGDRRGGQAKPDEAGALSSARSAASQQNNRALVEVHYHEEDLAAFEQTYRDMSLRAEQEEAAAAASKDAAEASRRARDEEDDRRRAAEWDAFDRDEQQRTDQLRADLREGVIQQDVLVL